MDIFESLENLSVSEECFDDIINIVEEYLFEGQKQLRKPFKKALPGLIRNAVKLTAENPHSDESFFARNDAVRAYEKSHPGRAHNDQLYDNIKDIANIAKRKMNIEQGKRNGQIQSKTGENGKKVITVKKNNGVDLSKKSSQQSNIVTKPIKHMYSNLVNPDAPVQSNDIQERKPKSDYKSFEKGVEDMKQRHIDKDFIENKNKALDSNTPEEAEEYTKKANIALKQLGSKIGIKNPKK